MLTSVLCVCVVTNILHEGLHIVSFYLGCCTSNYNLPSPLYTRGPLVATSNSPLNTNLLKKALLKKK